MSNQVTIRMMNIFVVEAGGIIHEELMAKSRKGISLMQYLILERGKPISSQRLIRELWSERRNENPENALKTMVSRLRATLNAISDGLGESIVSGQGSYRWVRREGVSVDVLDIIDILTALKKTSSDEERVQKTERLLKLYEGDLYLTGDILSGSAISNWLHNEYLNAVYRYVELLKENEAYNKICEVCKKAIRIDQMDDQLHIALMQAMVNLNRSKEADAEYHALVKRNWKYLDAEPSEELQESYETLAEAGKKLKFNLDIIRNELMEQEDEWKGPFFCDYEVFKEVYNIHMRNLERLGSTMFLGVILLGEEDRSENAVRRESCMAGLQEILKSNLRKGDIITRFSDNMYAMLLPTVNYATGSMVMERIEHLYYEEYPAGAIRFHARISPLGTVFSEIRK